MKTFRSVNTCRAWFNVLGEGCDEDSNAYENAKEHDRLRTFDSAGHAVLKLKGNDLEVEPYGCGEWKMYNVRGATTAQPSPKPKKSSRPRRSTPPEVYYENCAAVRAAGKAPLHRGQPGYGSHLDRDGDGVACET